MAGTILIVEDQESVRRLTRRVLSAAGYRILDAASGEEGLELAARTEEPIHLLVTDVVMPGLGGRELAARLREQRPELRVLFISGYPDDSRFLTGLDPSRMAFVQKPFSPSALVESVRALLAGGSG